MIKRFNDICVDRPTQPFNLISVSVIQVVDSNMQITSSFFISLFQDSNSEAQLVGFESYLLCYTEATFYRDMVEI